MSAPTPITTTATTPRPILRALAALALAALAAPAFAVGARCPEGNATAEIDPSFTNETLRCNRRALAQPLCPPSHPFYLVMPAQPGQSSLDICTTVNVIAPPPSGPLQVQPNCPPGMSRIANGGVGARDICRSAGTTQVPPLLIPN